MVMKYTVASATIVRTSAENLRADLLRYVYQIMTRNADISKHSPFSNHWGPKSG